MPRRGRTLEHPAIPTLPCSFRASRPLAPGQLLSWLPFSPSQAAVTPPHLPFPRPFTSTVSSGESLPHALARPSSLHFLHPMASASHKLPVKGGCQRHRNTLHSARWR